jgi:hypothetical protein
MERVGGVHERAPGAPMIAANGPTIGAAGIERYVDEIGRRLRDLARVERDSIAADLVQHLHEAGCRSFDECVERLGAPATYADGLREGLGLAPFRPARSPRIAALLVVVVALAGACAFWWASRPSPVPANFAPLQPMSSMIAGSHVRSAGTGMVIELGATETTDARLVAVLRNDSDRAIRVDHIGVPLIWVRANGTSTIGGSADEPLRRGEVELSAVWTTDVRIEPVADPFRIETTAHERTGAPFTPFIWDPGESYAISVAGPVAACRAELAPFDQRGGDVQVDFTVGNSYLTYTIGMWTLDTTAC